MTPEIAHDLHLCHHCDQLHHHVELARGEIANCTRCGSVIASNRSGGIEIAIALLLAALPTFIIANCFPIITLNLIGNTQSSLLITGVLQLADSGLWPLAVLVFLTSVVVPGIYLFGLLSVLTPLHFGKPPRYAGALFRWLLQIEAWNMLEIFLLGVLVALTKLGSIADLVLGPALYAFAALILLNTLTSAVLDKHAVWQQIPIKQQS